MTAKILVVDNEPDLVELLNVTLTRHGHHIFSASTGLDALHQARRHLPDLILLDLMLDDMDGFSVCEVLRSQPSTRGTPVIIMSALAGEMARLKSYHAGAVDFLGKPFRLHEVVGRVAALLQAQAERLAATPAPDPAA